MTRHGKNATSSAVYSYSERQKDAKQSGYGTLHERLGADSMKPFDCCSLTLEPCREPLISPQGFIFDREAILNYILDQKNAYKRKLRIWDQQNKLEREREEALLNEEKEKMKAKMLALESTTFQLPSPASNKTSKIAIGLKRLAGAAPTGGPSAKTVKEVKESEDSVSNMAGEKAKEWRSFWVPELSTSAEASKMEKPTQEILCPISGVPLKFKELMPVKFTPANPSEEFSKMLGKKDRYICPITRDILTNSTRLAYLKTSQSVVSMACVEKIIRKDLVDPLSGKPMKESDIIELQRGGTGYAATNEVKAKLIRPQLELQ